MHKRKYHNITRRYPIEKKKGRGKLKKKQYEFCFVTRKHDYGDGTSRLIGRIWRARGMHTIAAIIRTLLRIPSDCNNIIICKGGGEV